MKKERNINVIEQVYRNTLNDNPVAAANVLKTRLQLRDDRKCYSAVNFEIHCLRFLPLNPSLS